MAFKFKFPIAVVLLAALGLVGVFVFPQTANAGSAAGSGSGNGNVSSTCNRYNHTSASCPWTTNGPFGWRVFDVNDNSPNVPNGNGIWSSAQTQCHSVNAAQIIAFVMYTGTRTLPGAWIYKYNSAKLTSGFTITPPYITNGDAASRFASIGYSGPLKFGTDVGWFCYGNAEKWTIDGQSSISAADSTGKVTATAKGSTISANPGQTLNWAHTLTNNGPTDMKSDVSYNVTTGGGFLSAGFNNAALKSPVISGTASGVNGSTFVDTANGSYQTYYVQADDVGKTLCQQINWTPGSSTSAATSTSTQACAQIPYNYDLTPNVTVNPNVTVETNSIVSVTPTIDNKGPTKSQSIQWQLTQILVKPGASVPNSGGGTSANSAVPCGTYFSSLPQASCTMVANGTSVLSVSGTVITGTAISTYPIVIGDYPVGTKICYAMSVQPYSNSTTDWRHSAPICLTVGSRPKVQLIGGDLTTAKLVNTSTTVKSFNGTQYTFGSWIEYGIFAVGNIIGTASGSAYAGPGLSNANSCNESPLSFTNSTASGSCPSTAIGNYTNSSSIPDVSASFPTASAPVFSSGNLTSQASGVYAGSDPVTISGGNIAAGQWIVINAPGATVNITGDIQYSSGTMHSVSDIPQVVIIANNINIAGNVKQVDSWLIAKSSLNTCSDVLVTAPLDSKTCNQTLVVNGPVMAGQLYLRRTAGSGTGQANSGDPAETFNLRPDAYMWASLRAVGSGSRVQTVYTTELPPRL